MRIFVAVFGLLGLLVFGWGIATVRSDIQLIMAVVGLFSAAMLFGIAEVLGRQESILKALKRIEGRDDA